MQVANPQKNLNDPSAKIMNLEILQFYNLSVKSRNFSFLHGLLSPDMPNGFTSNMTRRGLVSVQLRLRATPMPVATFDIAFCDLACRHSTRKTPAELTRGIFPTAAHRPWEN